MLEILNGLWKREDNEGVRWFYQLNCNNDDGQQKKLLAWLNVREFKEESVREAR